jgi:hypothetical protein
MAKPEVGLFNSVFKRVVKRGQAVTCKSRFVLQCQSNMFHSTRIVLVKAGASPDSSGCLVQLDRRLSMNEIYVKKEAILNTGNPQPWHGLCDI